MGLFKKKQSIDPVEFLVLRNELVELKERLDASEQAKASLEDRLSSLAATTMVLSSNSKSDTAEIVEKIEALESRLEGSMSVGNKVDELHQRVIDVEQGGGGGGGAAIEPRFAELSHRLDQVAELAAAPVAPDDELASRLDALSRSAESVDLLQLQIGQINGRMSAQADMADQVTALSDRIGLLQQRNVDSDRINQRLDELAAASGTEEISERLALLGQRLTATEEATRAAAEQAATGAEIAEQLAVLERRITETSQQAGQADDLDQKVNALVSPATQQLEARLADVDARLQAQADLPDRLAELDAQLRAQSALADRLAQLDAQLQDQSAVAQRVDEIDERLVRLADANTVGAASAVGTDVSNLRQMMELRSADVAGLRELIDVRSIEIAEVRAQMAQLQAPSAALPPPDAATAGAGGPFTQQLGELAERVAMTAEDARFARDRAAALEQRIAELDQTTNGRIAQLDQTTSSRIDQLDQTTVNRITELDQSTVSRIDQLDQTTAGRIDQLDQTTVNRITELDQTTVSRIAELDQTTASRIDQRIEAEVVGRASELAASTDSTEELRDQLTDLWARVTASEDQARIANEQAAALSQRLADTGERTVHVDHRLGEVAARLDAQGNVDQQISEIWSRVVGAEEQNRIAHERAVSLEQALAETQATALAAQADAAQANTDEIDRQLAELRQRLDEQAQLPGRLAELDRRLSEMPDRSGDIQRLQERLSELAASVPDTGGLSDQLTELSTRIDANEQDARTALRQALAIDERVQNVSTQLANQLSELSREMDSLATRQPAATVQIDDGALQSLHTGQVKLASEQARYEISFREDLAALAEQVRSLRGRS